MFHNGCVSIKPCVSAPVESLGFTSNAAVPIFGLVFMMGALVGGPWLYAAMGGSGPALAASKVSTSLRPSQAAA
jgi:hypothetical protein